ncbi:MAG: hypothetical protein C7B45_07365 [Sulfobacillus acidophilus]|uniref:Uncharacterized protein n=1 Tax=Sulfobacillus acidophilus TaxID=53633 RepID=A0A2T2WJ99_9FIRM|nr:MAG: hypothetical protein C7B45_07365 [Sulfobacillus acidophilus]
MIAPLVYKRETPGAQADFPVTASSFPRYAVMWPSHQANTPVVFYAIKTAQSYAQLARYWRHHPEWQVSVGWSQRRFYHYQRELRRLGVDTLFYRQTHSGWILDTQAVKAPALTKVSAQFVPTGVHV